VGGTFTPSKLGRDIACGLDAHDAAGRQSTFDLLAAPFQARADAALLTSAAEQRESA
jgi:hypothetical protein